MKRFLRWALACAALSSVPARAQTFSIGQRTVTEGLVLPPESAATVEDAASGTLNPAGLGMMRGLQLEYFHERETPGAGIVGDGLYGAVTLFDVLAAGLSLEWVRPGDGLAAFHKTHWALALSPDRTFSLGVAYNLFGSSDPILNSLTSWDAGLTWRPWKFLSLAASARDFDNPALAATTAHAPRRFDGAVALRPFGSHFTLAGDYLFLTDGAAPSQNGPGNGRVGITAQLELAGFGVSLGTGIPVGRNQMTFGELGLSIATEHVAAIGAWSPALQGGSPLGTQALDVGFRISKESFRSIAPPLARVLRVDLAEALSSKSGALAVFSTSNQDPYEELLFALARATNDDGVRGVVFRVGDLGDLALGRIEELRGAIAALRGRGKLTVALLTGGADGTYYLAAACDRVFALPQTDYPLRGFASSSLYFAEGLEKIGVHVDVVRVGPYKSAPDALTRTGPSPEQLEVTHALLADATERYLAAVTQGRGVTAGAFQAVLARGLSTADELKAAGLIDEVVYPDQLHGKLQAQLRRPVIFEDVDLDPDEHQVTWSKLPQIAVVNVFGLITGGESQTGPFSFARTAGADSIVRALNAAGDSAEVAAVVVRVDSGGGDGAASELIWRAIQELRRRKPVVVSFGDVAASGGYYLAVAGDEVLAEPSTITGSIGVFALKPDLSGLLGKLGIHAHQDALTPNADLFSLAAPWSDSERAVVQSYIDAFYATFIARVAEGRRLSPAAVEAVGRGHVWSGRQAKDRGLIDGFGSFEDAVERAKARADLRPDQEINLVTFGSTKQLLNVSALLGTEATAPNQMSELMRTLVDAAGAAPILVLDSGHPLALPELLPRLK
jgi:protease-4